MAHDHFNGTCEQSARNYHGAISRNFGSGKLGARLSCGKTAMPYIGTVSACMVPLDYDEDTDLELERSIKMRPGYSRYKEVKAYARQQEIYADAPAPCALEIRVTKEESARLWDAIHAWEARPGDKAAFSVLDAYILKNAQRIPKRYMKLYRKGKADPVLLLYQSGMVAKGSSRSSQKTKVWKG